MKQKALEAIREAREAEIEAEAERDAGAISRHRAGTLGKRTF